jgi:hypothetical protein
MHSSVLDAIPCAHCEERVRNQNHMDGLVEELHMPNSFFASSLAKKVRSRPVSPCRSRSRTVQS